MPDKIGRYEVLRPLTSGGMADVYLAFDPNTDRQVVVKVIRHEYSDNQEFRARFKREAKLIAAFEHPAIVPMHDFDEQGGQPFIVMRYMPGGSLLDRLTQRSLTLPEIAQIVARVADALDDAHDKGILHRDLKPGNILFDAKGNAFLADFGIAKKIAETTTKLATTGFIGTPAYASPEQVEAKSELDRRTDVYSLGVIIFELLAGRLPYDADTPMGLALSHIKDPIPNILSINAKLPRAADGLIKKVLAKDREKRFRTAGELAQALTRMAQGGQPIRPDTSPVRTASTQPEPWAGEPITARAAEPTRASRLPPVVIMSAGTIIGVALCSLLALLGAIYTLPKLFVAVTPTSVGTSQTVNLLGLTNTPDLSLATVISSTAVPTQSVASIATEIQPTEVSQVTGQPVEITWYIGLGAGAQPAQIPLEKAFADKYNASQTEIQLIPIIIDNNVARDNLTAQIAAGNAPDIVGPVGTAGRAAFPGAWLDLEPLVQEFNYDTSDIDPAFLSFYKVEGKLEGLPFAIYPSAIYVNKTLFDEAGLPYPPQIVGQGYRLPDGTNALWSFDTVAKVARKLTFDSNGYDATSPNFDRNNIVQYGFNMQWNDDPRSFGSYFCAHYPVGANGKADIPDCWKAAWEWYYDAIWGLEPFMPNQAANDSDLLTGNAFSSGKVAMAESHLWYTCCIDGRNVTDLDMAIAPSYNGTITAKMHGDTFAILASSKHPREAFKVYSYMLGEGAQDLYAIYGGLPARKSQQAAFLADLEKNFAPSKPNFQVFLDMIPFLDAPNHELGLPNNAKANDAFIQLGSDFRSNGNLNLDNRISNFVAKLDQIYSESP